MFPYLNSLLVFETASAFYLGVPRVSVKMTLSHFICLRGQQKTVSRAISCLRATV